MNAACCVGCERIPASGCSCALKWSASRGSITGVAERHELASLLVDAIRTLAEARAERDSFRLVATQAIHYAHRQDLEIERLREQHRQLVIEYRAFREGVLRESMVMA